MQSEITTIQCRECGGQGRLAINGHMVWCPVCSGHCSVGVVDDPDLSRAELWLLFCERRRGESSFGRLWEWNARVEAAMAAVELINE